MNLKMPLRVGIVGTGMISNVIAKSIQLSSNAVVSAVSSRSEKSANIFAKTFNLDQSHSDWKELVNSKTVDAIYIGVPTVAKEEIAIKAVKSGKHILVDKPFENYKSLQRITNAARENKVCFMDGTHFVHHTRTKTIQENIPSQIGQVQAIHTSFFFPFLDRTNIRYNTSLEASGAIGDMAWYSVRAILEYLPNAREIKDIKTFVQIDSETGAIFRATGMIVFDDGSTSNWDVGYNAGVCIMDLDLLGTNGLISMDDYVLDWAKGFPFDNDNHKVGYILRKGMATPNEFEFIETPCEKSQTTLMIENFSNLIGFRENYQLVEDCMQKSERTQYLIDAIWDSIDFD